MAVRIAEEAWSGNISEGSEDVALSALTPSEGKTPLAPEYAKCKNRPSYFMIALRSVDRSLERQVLNGIAGLQEITEMSDDLSLPEVGTSNPERKPLSAAAQRALAEAEARRKAADVNTTPAPKEFQGPKGPEPTRYGDWEVKGIASDF
jgi:hypothetical protein